MDCGEREKGEGCEKDKETVKEKEKERDLEVGIRRGRTGRRNSER